MSYGAYNFQTGTPRVSHVAKRGITRIYEVAETYNM